MVEHGNDLKLPDLPPLSSISRRSANGKHCQSPAYTVNQKEKNISIVQEHENTTYESEIIERLTIMEDSVSDVNDTIIKDEKYKYLVTENEVEEIIVHNNETVINQTSVYYAEENPIQNQFVLDADNTLNRLNLYDTTMKSIQSNDTLMSTNEQDETTFLKFNKPPSVKSSASGFRQLKTSNQLGRPVPPPITISPIANTSSDDINPMDNLPSPLSKRRPNIQLTSRRTIDHGMQGASILPPRTDSSVSYMDPMAFNKSKYTTNRIKTTDLLEDLQLFQYAKPNSFINVNQQRNSSIGTNLTSLSSPISGDIDYFNKNNSVYLDFIQNRGSSGTSPFDSFVNNSSNTLIKVQTSNSKNNTNSGSNSYHFQYRVPSSSHKSENRTTSVSSYSGSKPLAQVPSVSMPTQLFKIDLLEEHHVKECVDVSSMNEIYQWLLKIYFEWFSDYLFDKLIFFQIIQILIEFHMTAKYNEAFINKNVDQIIESLLKQKAIKFEKGLSNELLMNDNLNNSVYSGSHRNLSVLTGDDDELTIITPGLDVFGVLPELTGCFCCQRFVTDSKYKCYSFTCSKFNINENSTQVSGNLSQNITSSHKKLKNGTIGVWSEYWNLTNEEIQSIPPLELKKQSFIFDLIILEERSINLANAATEIYGKQFYSSLLPKDPNFEDKAFGIFAKMANLHKAYILDPLYEKLNNDGKFINTVGEIYLRWVSNASKLYFEYTECMGYVNEVFEWEKAQPSSSFKKWIQEIEETPEIKMSKLYHDVIFLGGFFKSLQNLPLTLSSILKCITPEHDDYEFITIALEEIRALSNAVDKLLGITSDRCRILRINRQLVMNKHIKGKLDVLSDGQKRDLLTQVNQDEATEKLELRLNEKQRKLLCEGEVLKKKDFYRPPNVASHTKCLLFLFDNILLICEKVIKNGQYYYKLIERPIPIDYLNLESKFNVNQSLEFKIRNIATNESFSFLVPSTDILLRWTTSISSMLQMYNHNKEDPIIFKLKCVNDSFYYKDKKHSQSLTVPTKKSALDYALKHVYNKNGSLEENDEENLFSFYGNAQDDQDTFDDSNERFLSADVIRYLSFNFENLKYRLITTTSGIYLKSTAEKDQSMKKNGNRLGGWKLVCKVSNIEKIELCPMINFFIVLDAKGMLYYISCQSLIISYNKHVYDQNYKMIQNSSKDDEAVIGIVINDKVDDFNIADDLENSIQLCYQRKGKVICTIPEYDFSSNSIGCFKVHKSYKLPSGHHLTVNKNTSAAPNYIPTFVGNKHQITYFKESFIVAHSSKGFLLYNTVFNVNGMSLPHFPDVLIEPNYESEKKDEIVTLEKLSKEKLLLNRVQEIMRGKISAIKSFMIHSGKNIVFVYSNTVVLVNNSGYVVNGIKDVLMIDFNINSCEMHGDYLILCGDNLVQIYDLNQQLLVEAPMSEISLCQIVKGKKMRIISSEITSKPVLLMSHPLIVGKQLVLELVKK